MITTKQIERFNARVQLSPSGCHEWTGKKKSTGYGRFYDGGKFYAAHRVAYTIASGAVPDGLEIDHICRNRGCVNPAHLRAITHKQNLLCGDTIVARQAAQTSCKRGHPLSGGNLRIEGTRRRCRQCANARRRRVTNG